MTGKDVAENSAEYRHDSATAMEGGSAGNAGAISGGNLVPAGYKQTEVGVIPEDWDCTPAGEQITFVGGYSFSSRSATDSGIRWLKIANVGINEIKWDAASFLPKDFAESHQDFLLKEEDIVMALTRPILGLQLKVSRLGRKDVPALLNQRVARLDSKGDFSKLFAYYLVQRLDFVAAMNLSMAGSDPPNIGTKALSKIQIGVPRGVEEQTAIANALSDVDALINELEKLITKKQAIKTATMQQLLTGRTRLPQYAHREDGTQTNSSGTNLNASSGGPKGGGQDGLRNGYKPSELGEVPEDWEETKMGTLGYTYGGLSGKSKADFGLGNAYYVPFTNVMSNVVVDVGLLEKVVVSEAQNEVVKNDLLFNGSSETPEEVCFSSLVNVDIENLYLNSFCFGFRASKENSFLPLYMAYWFRSELGRSAVSIMAQGSTRYNISKSQFLKISIVLPEREEQIAIATILSDMDEEIQTLQQRLNKTRQIKQGMMQELLTGKTRLM